MLTALDRGVARVETAVLVMVVAVLLLLAFAQVVLKLCGAGIEWMEMLGRWLVLWVGFLGGAVASHQGRHITIDVISRFARGTTRRMLGTVVNVVGVALSLVLLKIALAYLSRKITDGSVAFSIGGTDIPEWWMAVVVPAGLLLMAWHFAVQAIAPADLAGTGAIPTDDRVGGEP